jgi:ABC-type multidrug transport system ATPase subunit
MLCSGVVIRDFSIPAFTLNEGEMLFMKLPARTIDEEVLYNILLKKQKVNGLKINGKPLRIGALALNTSLFFRLRWHKKTVFDYLKSFTNLKPSQIEEILRGFKISPFTKLGVVGGTQRLLLEIEIAMCGDVNIIIFSTDGLDPLGSIMLVELVRSKLLKISAICICLPLINNDSYKEADTCSEIKIINENVVYVTTHLA